MGNSFGKIFKITSFGESHGVACGVIIDGCPAGLQVELAAIQAFLDRRRPAQSHLTSPRQELDQVKCLSGLEEGLSLGSPITLLVSNKDVKTSDYTELSQGFRPSHADHTYWLKYGLRARSGGGRASARETLARVAAAGLALQVLKKISPRTKILAYVDSIHTICLPEPYLENPRREDIEKSLVRCPDEKHSKLMQEKIEEAMTKGDSLGGTIACQIFNPPAGLGSPVFDKLEAELAKAIMSLPACRAFEIGDGFQATKLYGSEHNDLFYMKDKKIRTKTNHAGGIVAGISNGETIRFRCAFKPTSTLKMTQETVNEKGESKKISAKAGRHDPCVLPRAVALVEAMAILVITDYLLLHKATKL